MANAGAQDAGAAARPYISYRFALAGSIGVMVSLAGDELLRVAVILATTNGQLTIALGLFGFVTAAPALLAPVVGHCIDRLHKRPRLVFGALAGSGVVCTTALWAIWGTEASQSFVYLLIFLVELGAVATAIAWPSYVAEFAPAKSEEARRIVANTSLVLAIGPILGPLAVTILASQISLRSLVLGELISYTLTFLLVQPSLVRLQSLRTAERGPLEAPPKLSFRGLARGVRMVFASDLVRTPLCVLAVSNGLAYLVFLSLPVLAMIRTGNVELAASLTSVELVAGLFGVTLGGRVRSNQHFRLYTSLEPLLRGTGILIIAALTPTWTMYIGTVLFALPQGIGRVGRLWFLSQAFEAGQRGTANGGYRFIARLLMPFLPFLIIPAVSDSELAITSLFYGIAVAFVAAATIPWIDRRFGNALRGPLGNTLVAAAR